MKILIMIAYLFIFTLLGSCSIKRNISHSEMEKAIIQINGPSFISPKICYDEFLNKAPCLNRLRVVE